MHVNTDSITDSIVYLFKLLFELISHKDDIIDTTSPNNSNGYFS